MQKILLIIAVLGIFAWFIYGTTAKMAENTFWPDSAAPWENVIGFYYPNKDNHADHFKTQDSGTVAQCVNWAEVTIAASSDASGEHSDYLCGIGCTSMTDVKSCRTTTKQ